jgi:FG-GAP-like repeat/Bacterial Ig-like domain (group 3)/FG-GAP repeat
VTASFAPNPTTGFSTLTLTAGSSAPLGTSTLTITGASGTQTATTTLTLGVYTPTFTVASDGLNIGLGTSATSTVVVTPQYGFSGSVKLSVSGLPSGVTASFAPNPTTSYSTLTVTAGSTAPLGQYPLIITGTSGTQTATTTLTLGVYVAGFTLSTPGTVALGQGSSTTAYISESPQYGFSGNVSLSVSGLPSGVTASFAPNPITSYTALTLTAASTVTPGPYALTITGVSGTQTVTAPLNLGVYVPRFTLSSGNIDLGPGTSGSTNIEVSPQYGFSGSVNLSVSGLPSGVTASWSPNPASAYSTLTLTAGSSAVPGQYTLTVAGASGTETETTTVQLGVEAPGFTVGYSNYTLIMNQGGSASDTINVYPQWGFTGSVNLTASDLPSGVTAAFSPNPSTGSSTLTLTAGSAATPGYATVTITGRSGSLTASTSISLTVNAASFAISSAPGKVNLAPGDSAESTVAVIPQYGFAGNVTFAAAGLPSGVTAAFSPNPATGTSVLTLTAGSSAPVGAKTVTITGTSGSQTATTSLLLAIGTPASTTTTLKISSAGTPVTSVASGTVVLLTAAVSGGSTGLTGQVNFCDATAALCDAIHLIGSAQLTGAGIASLPFIPGTGSHSYKAVFAGTLADGASSSAASSLTVTASQPSTTTIASSGNPGNYTLTATVTGEGPVAPGGTVSFLDTSSANAVLGSAALGNAVAALHWENPQSPATGAEPWSIALGDFNGDGIPDLAATNLNSNNVTILLGNGDGTFSAAAASPPTGSQPAFVTVGDFNRDGKADLAVANLNSNNVTILLGNGDGTFTAAASSPETGSQPEPMAVGDFNGDGLQDLAVLNESSATVTVLLGNGDGTFTASPLSAQTNQEPTSMVSGDFNGDGSPDLAVTNTAANTVTILLGNGDGSFTPAPSPATGNSPYGGAVADFNLDGKLDLAVGSGTGNTLTILLGNGDGTFTPAAASPAATSLTLSVADLNRDGKPDLVAANGATITTLLGNGDGTFGAPNIQSTGGDPVSIAVGDLNGDGIQDLAAANADRNTISILTLQLDQVATATATGLAPSGSGTHNVEASYPGDASYRSSVSATTALTAALITPTLTVTPLSAAITTAQALTVNITVSGGSGNATPTGSATLTSGSYTSAAAVLSSGHATLNIPAGSLAAGADTLTVTYTPDSSSSSIYSGGGGSGLVTVTATNEAKVTPAVSVTPSSSSITTAQALTVGVTVSGGSGNAPPAGSVTLASGSYSSQQSLAAGAATFSLAAGALPVGVDTLSATYTPDASATGSYTTATQSASVTVTQEQGAVAPFMMSVTPLSPASAGSSATGSVTLTASSTYSGTLNLACSLTAPPAGAQQLPTCSLNPASLTLAASGSGTAVLTVSTTAASPASARLNFWPMGGGSVLVALIMFGLPSRRHRWPSALLVLLVILGGGVIGCGGGSTGGSEKSVQPTTPATTAGSYTFTVTATDTANAKLTASANVTLTVP